MDEAEARRIAETIISHTKRLLKSKTVTLGAVLVGLATYRNDLVDRGAPDHIIALIDKFASHYAVDPCDLDDSQL